MLGAGFDVPAGEMIDALRYLKWCPRLSTQPTQTLSRTAQKNPAVAQILPCVRSRSVAEKGCRPKELLYFGASAKPFSSRTFIAGRSSPNLPVLGGQKGVCNCLKNCPSEAPAASVQPSDLIMAQLNRFMACARWHMAGRLSAIVRIG